MLHFNWFCSYELNGSWECVRYSMFTEKLDAAYNTCIFRWCVCHKLVFTWVKIGTKQIQTHVSLV